MKTPRLTPSTISCLLWLATGIYLFTRMAFDNEEPKPVEWTIWKCALMYAVLFVAPLTFGYWAGQENKDDK